MSTDRKIPLIDEVWEIGVYEQELLKTIGEAIFDLGTLNIPSLVKNLVKTVKHKEGLQDKAFELVFTALHNACTQLIRLHCPETIDKNRHLVEAKKGFRLDARQQIKNLKAGIDTQFFSNPAAWSFFNVFQPSYTLWLTDFMGIEINTAQMLSSRLPGQFWTALIEEWDTNPVKYQPIINHLKQNPFHNENLNLFKKREKYYQNLLSTTTLQLPYIEPQFKIHQLNLPGTNEQYSNGDKDDFILLETKSKDLTDFAKNYFLKNESAFNIEIPGEKSRLLFLMGQPGQGKTTFCTKLINELLINWSKDKELIFVNIEDLNPKKFLDNPIQELKSQLNEYQFSFENGLLVLDGLDELDIREGFVTNADLIHFFRNFSRQIAKKQNLFVIITSRLHFVNLSKVNDKEILALSLAPFNFSQQHQ